MYQYPGDIEDALQQGISVNINGNHFAQMTSGSDVRPFYGEDPQGYYQNRYSANFEGNDMQNTQLSLTLGSESNGKFILANNPYPNEQTSHSTAIWLMPGLALQDLMAGPY